MFSVISRDPCSPGGGPPPAAKNAFPFAGGSATLSAMSPQRSPTEETIAATEFAAYWTGKGYEKGESQPYWLSLLRVLGVEAPERCIEFEDAAHIDAHHGFIDAYIPSTHVLIEQKSLGLDLRATIRQSDGSRLTPFQQAQRYANTLPYSRRPRWIVTCNFAEFLVYDMENPNAEPESILLSNFPGDLYRLRFLVDERNDRVAREMEVSITAGEIVGRIHDALLAQYRDDSPETLHALNVLCVRLVFCLYAEDAGIFRDDQFHDYLAAFATDQIRQALLSLFDVLDTPPDRRSRYLSDALAAFPYVNGGLFSGPVEIPQFTAELRDTILQRASLDFDWSEISPTIFGAVFESTLNPETRHDGGMHYTSIENIHKVIDPLFLDALRDELRSILEIPVERTRTARLRAYQDKLAAPTFLDPACGSGNFLTETYLSLRRLENRAIDAMLTTARANQRIRTRQAIFDYEDNPIRVRVSINQFYGIEINDFAVSVAKTALWIAESQMLAETAELLRRPLDFLPLKSYDGITEGNALRLDWAALSDRPFSYVMGNPPFIGARVMSPGQKADLAAVFGPAWRNLGNLDYVSGWYKKASDLMKASPATRTALVSTNSVCQGEAPATLWKPLFADGVSIDFAHRTFRWDSESTGMAHVHCVIVGFSRRPRTPPLPLYDNGRMTLVPHINAYLTPIQDVFIESRRSALSAPRPLVFGSMPNDDGHLSDWSPERRADLLARYPQAAPLFRRITGSHEYINGIERWCLWLPAAAPDLIRSIPPVKEALEAVRAKRLASQREATRRLADTPSLFGEIRQPASGNYLIIPSVSSERRRYVPMGFLPSDIIATNLALIVPDATPYHFGILTSNVHMAWMRAVAGRLESRYRYSANIVYNNFPWPTPTPAQTARIEATAQAILDARAAHPASTLAALYDQTTMPTDLLEAHRANDRAVLAAYGFPSRIAESDCVAELFKLYQRLTAPT